MSTANYTGKEAAHIKHELVRAYLEPLFMIIGQQTLRVSYVGYSPQPSQKGGLEQREPVSAAVPLTVMEKCHNELAERFRKNVQFRALFIEKDKGPFGRLESFLKSESWNGVEAHCIMGDFCDLRSEILLWCGDRDFCFFFIDANEWRHIAIPYLAPLLGRPASEFLINFKFDSLLRAPGQKSVDEHMEAIFGEVPDISDIAPEQRERSLFNLYCRVLKASAPIIEDEIPRCAHMRVLDPAKDSTVCDLVYLTWNPLGIVSFMDASEQLEVEQKKARALARQSKKVKRSRQLELFSADRYAQEEPAVDSTKVKEYWLAKLSHAPKRFGVTEFADMLEETGWFMEEFQRAFLELEREGKVRNLASSGMRTGDPVRYWANGNRGEFLEKIEQKRSKSK
jgi:three-Cys-motif partner protein